MAFNSFRDFLNRLEVAGELRRVARPIATELEITELADREMKKPGGGQARLAPEVHPALLDDQDESDLAYWKATQQPGHRSG